MCRASALNCNKLIFKCSGRWQYSWFSVHTTASCIQVTDWNSHWAFMYFPFIMHAFSQRQVMYKRPLTPPQKNQTKKVIVFIKLYDKWVFYFPPLWALFAVFFWLFLACCSELLKYLSNGAGLSALVWKIGSSAVSVNKSSFLVAFAELTHSWHFLSSTDDCPQPAAPL